MEMNAFQTILQQASFGYAYQKIILNSKGKPIDFEFVFVNNAFLEITGSKGKELSGRKVSEIFPDIYADEFNWIDFYGQIAISQKSEEIEQYSSSMNKWLKITAHSEKKHYFSTLITDVSDQYLLIDAVKQLQEYSLNNIDYKQITRTLRHISGAQYAVFNQYDTGSKNFTTKAVSGLGKKVESIIHMLGFNPEGKHWKHDLHREKLTEGRKITIFNKFSDLTHKSLPVSVANALAKTFHLKASILIKIEKDKTLLGDFTLFFDKTPDLSKLKKSEHYADAVAMLVSRLEDEKSILESKTRLKSLFDQTNDAVFILSLEGKHLDLNQRAAKMLGYNYDEIIDLSIRNLSAETEKSTNVLKKLLNGEEVLPYERLFRKKNGDIIPVEINAQLVRDSNNQPLYIQSVVRDITQRVIDRKALEQRDALLQKLSKQVPGVIYQYQYYPDGRNFFPYASENIYQVYEVTPQQVKDDASLVLSRLHPDDHQKVIDSILESYHSLNTWEYEYRVILPEKGLRWLRGVANPEKLNDGSVIWHGYIFDITARKNKEQEGMAQSALLRSLLDSIPDQIAYKDSQGRYLGCNPQFEKYAGKPAAEILGKTDFDLFDRETAEFFHENDRRVKLIAGPRKNEEWVTYPNGSKILFETIKVPFKGPDGSVMGILGISRDITDRSVAEEKIRKLSMAVHQSPVSIVITNIDGEIEYVNPQFTITTGYSYKEAIGENPRILKSGVFSPGHYEDLWEKISGGKQWRGEMHNKRKNGELFWEFASISPLKNSSGEITHYIAVKEDITERKAAEEKIHQSEMFQRALLENLAVGVMIIDPETRVIKRVNPYAAKLIGAPQEEITGRVCHQFICPAMEKSCPICDMNQEVDNSDKILIRADGSQIPILKTVKVINLKGKDVLLESFVDISDKKKAEEALKNNQELLQSVLQSQRELICRFKADTTLTYVNESYAGFFGRKPDQLLGMKWVDLVPEERHDAIRKHLDSLIKGNLEQITFEHEVRLYDGTNRWVQWTDYVIRDKDGVFLEFQSVGNDVTDVKEREKLEKEVEISRNTLRFKQNFLASMSHEMRTPLTGIMGTTQLLEKTALTDNQQDFLSILKQSSENLSVIIDQVLDYSRLESGNIQLLFEDHTLFDIEKKSHQLFNSLCTKPIVFKSYIDPSIPEFLKFDKKRILQNINNLLINAIKFTEEGEISIKISRQSKMSIDSESFMLKVEISDTGIGIRDEKKKTIFSPFSQVQHIETEKYKGIGLGLAICREIAELHGGETGLTSKPGKGTKVWFTFKALPADKFKPDQTSTTKLYQNLNILFVEDNRTTQKVVKLMLNGLGHRVSLADNGRDALSNFDLVDFDIILMDIQMPVMDGIRATQEIKRKYQKPPVIIALSANAFEGAREKYMSQGMDEFLAKPFNTDEFQKMIPALLG